MRVEPRRTMHCAERRRRREINFAFRTAASPFLVRRRPRLPPCLKTRSAKWRARLFRREAVAMSPDTPEEKTTVRRRERTWKGLGAPFAREFAEATAIALMRISLSLLLFSFSAGRATS